MTERQAALLILLLTATEPETPPPTYTQRGDRVKAQRYIAARQRQFDVSALPRYGRWPSESLGRSRQAVAHSEEEGEGCGPARPWREGALRQGHRSKA